jgi:hypothetical protein
MRCEFQIGDLVRLKTGNSPQKIYDIRRSFTLQMYELACYYLTDVNYHQRNGLDVGGAPRKWRRADDFVRYAEEPIQQLPGEEIIVADLYQVKTDLNRFGTALMIGDKPLRNSAGHIVLEMKGEGGKVEVFDEFMIELVTPFTVKLHRLTIGDKGGETQMDVIAEAGQVQKDDVLLELNSGHLWRVTALDTKCRSAKENRSKWIKLQTETIRFGSNE